MTENNFEREQTKETHFVVLSGRPENQRWQQQKTKSFQRWREERGGGGHSSNLIYVKYLPAGNSVDTQPRRESVIFSFFPRDWKHVHRRLWLKAALEFPSFTRWIITPQQQQQQQQCRDHYSLHSQLDYLLRLGTTRKNSRFMRFSLLLSFFVIYFVMDKLNWHGKCQTVWREKCSLDFSLFWSATSHHYLDATRSLLAALHFLLSFSIIPTTSTSSYT